MKLDIQSPSSLSDHALLAEVLQLARCEREATVRLIAHLAELDARRLYLGAGFSSLFTYCTGELRLAEHAAYNRIEAARTARSFPAVLEMLGEGALTLTTVRLLAPHLTGDNSRELLAAAARKSRREVEELLARLFPQPPVPSSVRKLPAPTPGPIEAQPSALAPMPASIALSVEQPAVATPTRRPVLAPLAPDRYEIRFTASARTYEKLRLAQDMLRHAIPNGDPAEIMDRALTVLLEELARKKFAKTDRPRASQGTAPGSRDVPARVKRAVWLRDRGCCAFVGKGGRRCGERGFLEFHHQEPHGVGGEPTVENIELRCRAHNAYEAELFYGPNHRTRLGTSSRREASSARGGNVAALRPTWSGSS
jgi:hypothetical protein